MIERVSSRWNFGVVRLIRVMVLFMKSDPWMTIYPGTVFGCAAAYHARLHPIEFVIGVAGAFVYGTAALAVHVLCSQLVSVSEDRINKPWRPIPSGMISESEAKIWRDVLLVVFPLLGLALGVVTQALLCELIVVSDAHIRWQDRHPLCKNIYTAALPWWGWLACWQVVSPLTDGARRVAITASVVIMITGHVQDLRDMDGDRRTGRRTAPLVWGEQRVRRILCVCVALAPAATFVVADPLRHGPWSWIVWAISAILALTCAVRLVTRRGKAADQCTYRRWEQWLTSIALSAMFL